MLPFGVTIPASVPQRSEILEGLLNYPVLSITSRSVVLRMRNVSDKICTENLNTHFVFNKLHFLLNPTIYEITRQSKVQAADENMTHANCMLDT
jgi:hypothetical protein